MPMTSPSIGRRALAAAIPSSAVMLATSPTAMGQAANAVNFIGWSAAVDQVRAQITAFQAATGIAVNYENFPFAQYRTALVTRLVANAPIDCSWISDAWLPEFAEAGWLADISDVPALMRYNAEAAQYCTQSMVYDGKQYGLSYYGDHMSFMVNTDMLARAGITTPPTTWEEVVEQSLRMKAQGIAEFPLLLSLAADTWLIEFVSALTFSFGGRFVDDAGHFGDGRRQPGHGARGAFPARGHPHPSHPFPRRGGNGRDQRAARFRQRRACLRHRPHLSHPCAERLGAVEPPRARSGWH